jgi:hypothetical protein
MAERVGSRAHNRVVSTSARDRPREYKDVNDEDDEEDERAGRKKAEGKDD